MFWIKLVALFVVAISVSASSGCAAFTCSRAQARSWQLDDNTEVVAFREKSYCLVSKDPSINYDRAGCRVYGAERKVCSSIEPSASIGNLEDIEARTNESHSMVWLVNKKDKAIVSCVCWRQKGSSQSAIEPVSVGPDSGILLQQLDKVH